VRKYWHVLQIGIQNTLVYRANFFIRALFNLVPLLATLSLWRAIYEGKGGDVAGYTLAQMVSYYIVVTMVDALTAVTEDDWQIAADIKDGLISQFVVKPMDYLYYRLSLFVSGRLVYTMAAAGPVAVFVLMEHEYLLPPAGVWGLFCFGVSLVMSALLQFLLSYTVAMLAFWILEISTFVFILLAFERIASGQMFPLDILPPAVAQVLMCTPFAYQSFFPACIYMGRVTGTELVQGLLVQALWVAACYGLARWAWNRGLRSYSAVGG
jgi:ABC-2 type transport system permease protein